MQTIPSVYSLIDSLLPTWTVYPLTNELCLPDLTFSAVLICLVTCLPPALTTCPNTVYDSALSTLFLTLECDLCLFDLFGDLIKLHMDLNDTASALQKTSPPIDPAAFYHFTTEVTTQASILATHQQQLNRLTLLSEEMLKALQDLRLHTPAVQPPPRAPPHTATASSSPTSPRLAFPDKFDGTSSKCKGFLLQCSMFVNQQPLLYPTDDSRIAFVCSLLTGRALEWATAVWRDDHSVFPTFSAFIQRFKEVFEHPAGGKEVGEQLISLRQGRGTAADYALSFRTLAAQTGWPDDPLKLHFRKGLNSELQSELACRDDGKTLDQFIDLAIRVDNLIHTRRPQRHLSTATDMTTSSSGPEPMQIGFTHLSVEERERRVRQNLCLYCGLSGHLRATCPTRPSRTSSAVSDNQIPPNVLELPSEYHDLTEAFSKTKSTQLPPHRAGDCAIDLQPGSQPPKGRIFPLSQPEAEAMKSYIEEELAKGFIRPSTSPASAGFFFVKKKDGGLRPCIDYRGLNEISIKFRYPLPLVPAALEQLREARYFTKLDLRSAYNLIRIREGDEWKTAFSTTSGHYEYRVMPFGLSNSPSVFQSFINEVFRDMLNRWLIVYIDDILIYSRSLREHVQHVRAVLRRLIDHQLYAKAEKCEFHQESVSFLGYVISSGGVAMEDQKVHTVVNWPQPTNLKELQRFLGFANFYRRFIRNFSSIAAPLTSMTKRSSQRLTWSPTARQAFQTLKERFTTAPILHHPDPEREFVVEVDASSTGIGAVLSQRQGDPLKLYPCAFYSRKLTPAEQNYDVGNRELLAMKAALEEWHHWLEGAKHPFTVLTDHRNLEYLKSAKRLNHRQARWALFFTRFDFRITYRPGSQNTKADALSRLYESSTSKPSQELILPSSIILAPIQWDIMTEIAEAQNADPSPAETPPNLTYVPQVLRQRVLKLVHSAPSSGHPGIAATIQLLNNRFWWPSIPTDTITYIKNCETCNISKSPHQLPAGLLHPLPIPQCPWSHIAIDFVTDLPVSQGHTTILTVIDRFSKACRLIPLPKLPTALETAESLCNYVFRLYGLPEDIVSDRGPQFTSHVWKAFCQKLNINISLTSGYHPQSNGQVERLNQELTRFLRSYCHRNQSDWSRYLFWAEYAQNSLHKPATGITPFQCILGFQPPLFPWSGEPSELPAINSWLQRSEEVWNEAHTHLQRAVLRTQEQANRHRRPNPDYQPGQWVWLSTRDLRLRLPCKKLSPRYVGPFKITRQITPVSFCLALPAHYRISPTFHVSLLKPAGGPRGEEIQEEAVDQRAPPLIIDGEEAYQVREILDSRHRGRILQYLVDWEGYGPEERSWVNAEDILDPSLTTDFHRDHPEKPAPRPRGRPRRRLPLRFRSRSQGGGSVTNSASVAPSDRHQRESSPEF